MDGRRSGHRFFLCLVAWATVSQALAEHLSRCLCSGDETEIHSGLSKCRGVKNPGKTQSSSIIEVLLPALKYFCKESFLQSRSVEVTSCF